MLKYPSNRTAFTTGSSNQGSFILLEHPCSNLKRLALEVIKLRVVTGVRETAHERAVDGDNSVLHEIPTKNHRKSY